MDPDHLKGWIGRTETRSDVIGTTPMVQFDATLDRTEAGITNGDAVFPLAHWLFFNPAAPARDIGADGHPLRGGFLPPVELPRRMWAGSRIEFSHALRVDDRATRTSTIKDVQLKHGRSGTLVFVTVRHEVRVATRVALVEEQDIVYRDAPAPDAATPAPAAPLERTSDFERTIHPDPVLLFRYSAMTFNGHRIHYDRSYATEVEGYPGLVVHGPLIATLLVDLLVSNFPKARLARFDFKAVSPLFDTHDFRVRGRRIDATRVALWAETHDARLAMDASAELR